MSSLALVTITWSNEPSFDIENTTLYKSFKNFNPNHQFAHFHFNRGHYHQQEAEFHERFDQQSDYILYKICMLKEKLQNHVTSEYVIFCDANDVVCLGNVDHLLNTFDLENHVVVGAEKNQWPVPERKLGWAGFKDYSGFDAENQFYVNSGMVLAKRTNFIEMLESMKRNILSTNIKNFMNDQAVYTWHYTAKSLPLIELDYNTTFAVNTFKRSCEEYYLNNEQRLVSKATGEKPCFVHDNGWNHGSPKYVNHFQLKQTYESKHTSNTNSTKTMKLNILTTGVLGNDPLINYASDQLCKAEFEKYFDTKWIIVTHNLERSNICKSQAQNFKNVSVVLDEDSRKDRTGSTRRALVGINEGEYVWMLPEGFIPSPDCALKISELLAKNSSIAIEGTKCSGLDHIIFSMPDRLAFKDTESMLSFFNDVRKNGLEVPSEELSIGSVVCTGEIKHGAKSDMERLSVIYWNLKYSFHKYTNVYESLLNRKRFSTTSLLEIGVAQGASLRTFRDFFPNAKIFGLDIYPESILNEPRVEVVIGNSSEADPFLKLKSLNGDKTFDIIVDDGSHNPMDQLKSFKILWPMLSEDGLYIIEDVTDEPWLKNELAKMVPKSSIVTFDLRPQSRLVDSGVVVISK